MQHEITVFLADDHRLLRELLARFLAASGGFVVVGEGATGEEAIERVPSLDPDVAVIDVVMPGLDGIRMTSITPGRLLQGSMAAPTTDLP